MKRPSKLMNLANEYKQQYGWRAWPTVFDALPSPAGQTVFDLGCGVGDLAAAFAARGARVVGFDTSEELLHEARGRHLKNAEFRIVDLRSFPDPGVLADGLWCSFAAAYFKDLPAVLAVWAKHLKPGGWIALTEIDDMFSHEPLADRTKTLLSAYADESWAAGRYDFRMGRKLAGALEKSGFQVLKNWVLADQEFCFDGPAGPGVVDGWRARFERMRLLREFCRPHSEQVLRDFLDCLTRADHTSLAKVYCCIGTKQGV